MTALWTLYKRETGQYFGTPAAYVAAIVFLLISGYFFATPLFIVNQASIQSYIDTAPLLMTFFIPALTMRLFAEEFKTGTAEVLLSMPLRDWQIITAKLLAALTVAGAAIALTLIYPLTVGMFGTLDWRAAVCAYAGLMLTALMLCSAGLFASVISRSQIIGFIVGFLLVFGFYVVGKISSFVPPWFASFTDFMGLDLHLDNLARGVIDSRDLMYFLSVSGFFIFLTQAALWNERLD